MRPATWPLDHPGTVRARALPAQSSGGGIGRGAEPPSEEAWVDDYATLLVKVEPRS